MRKFPVAIATFLLIGGCAVKPVPDDVTGLTTASIAEKVKCETQDGIYDLLIKRLTEADTRASLDIRDAIQQNKANIVLLKNNYKVLPERYAKIFARFEDTVIVYDFQLRMVETNSLGAAANLTRPLTGTLELIGFEAANNKIRDNFRTFRITTNLKEIMANQNCEIIRSGGPNWEYPIAGKIGLKESFETYYDIAGDNDLSAIKDWPGASPFVDTIKFTTTVSAEVNPGINVTSSGRGYYFKDVSGSLGASRKDEHQLTLGISLPVKTKYARVGPSTPQLVNYQVDRSITKSFIFNLDPLAPFGPLNGR